MRGSFGALVLLAAGGSARATEISDTELFHEQVWPLLQRACLGCHGEEEPENGLRVDGREALIRGGKAGPAVKPGSPAGSLLVQAVRGNHEDLLMPPKRRLPEHEIALLETWVRRGLPWPAPRAAQAAAVRADTGPRWRRTWWQGPSRAEPPPALALESHRSLAAGEIDRFVLDELEDLGIEPVAPSGRRAWLRRATYLLTGALPTKAEVDAFVADPADDPPVREKAVQRLLASPRYGEHWARLWVREVLPEAEGKAGAYVAWLASAWNRDLPLDAFVRAHLPGTEDPAPERASGPLELLALAGAWRQPDQSPADAQVATVGRAFLALDLECARCHDHPIDPVRRSDHQALAALLIPRDEGSRAHAPGQPSPLIASLEAARNPLVARVVVNRIWRQYFGRGLVATPDDFGARGEPPTHRALLDHLAAKLAAGGGSFKRLHREIALSSTFALAVVRGTGQEKRDPHNAFLWRANPREVDERAAAAAVAALAADGAGKGKTAADRVWARVLAAAGRSARPDPRAHVRELYRLVLGREPGPAELDAALTFLAARPGRGPALTSILLGCEELRWLL